MAFPDGWTKRIPLTVDNTKVGAGGVAAFPMLVSGVNLPAAFWSGCQANGADLRFSVDGINALSHELVTFTPGASTMQAWVKVVALSSADPTVVYAYYGNAAATMPSAAEQQATWDGAYRRFHLSDNVDNTTVMDAAGVMNGTAARNTSLFSAAGKVGNALLFNGTSDKVDIGDLTDIEGQSQLTVSAWVKPVVLRTAYPALLAKTDASSCLDMLLWDTNGNVFVRVGPGLGYGYSSSAPLGVNTWAKWTMVFDGTQVGTARLKCYINGANVPLTYFGTPPSAIMANTVNANVGRYTYTNIFLNSTIDEMVLWKSAQTLAWDLTEHNNQFSPGTFYAVGAEESLIVGGLPIIGTRLLGRTGPSLAGVR